MRVAYLASHYPAVSHTFVQREVRALRDRGVQVDTCSIWRARPEHLLSDADRSEFERTHSLLPCRAAALIRAHLEAFAHRPARYLATLALALRLRPPGLRPRLWRLFYFAEAMLLWRHLHALGVRHVHAQFADSATDVAMLLSHFERADGPGQDGWTWSLAVHGPVEFYDVSENRLAEKIRRALFVIAISDFGRSQLMTLVSEELWSKLHVVHCGVDPEVFALPAARPVRSGVASVLFVGRLVHLKGQSILLEALGELRDRGLEVRAVFIGDGPKRADLERRVHALGLDETVRFPGSVGQDEIRHHYAAADVFCLPSFAEGVPVVLMEAMAMGLPVVSTRIMGIPELVEHGVNGLLVRPGRVDELADALERIVADPEQGARMGGAGREKVSVEYDLHRSAARLEGIMRGALPAL